MCRNWFVSSLVSSLAVTILAVSHAAASPAAALTPSSLRNLDEGTVEAEGRGATVVDAKKDAIVNGLRQIVGEYVRSDTVIENDEVVEDVIRTFTTGQQVRSEQIGEVESTDDGQFVVRMRVTTNPRLLESEYEAAAASAYFVDGETLAAELEFAANNIAKQRDLFADLSVGLRNKLLVNRLVDREGNPVNGANFSRDQVKRRLDGSVLLKMNVQTYFDRAAWYQRVGPKLRAALNMMAIAKAESALEFDLRPVSFAEANWWWRRVPFAAFTNIPLYRINNAWPNRRDRFGGLGTADGVDEMVVFVSRDRDRVGQSEIFDAYRIPKQVFPSQNLRDPAERRLVRVSLLDANGSVLIRKDLRIGSDDIALGGQKVSLGALCDWGVSKHRGQNRWPVGSEEDLTSVFLTPRFFFLGSNLVFSVVESDGSLWQQDGKPLIPKVLFTDAVVTPLEIELGSGILEQVTEVVLESRMGR